MPTSRREFLGALGTMPLVACRRDVAFHDAIGIAAIEARDRALTKRLRDGLATIDRVKVHSATKPDLHAAVTTFAIDGVNPADVMARTWATKIRIRSVHDEYGCRVGTHDYCTEHEIDRLLDVVATIART